MSMRGCLVCFSGWFCDVACKTVHICHLQFRCPKCLFCSPCDGFTVVSSRRRVPPCACCRLHRGLAVLHFAQRLELVVIAHNNNCTIEFRQTVLADLSEHAGGVVCARRHAVVYSQQSYTATVAALRANSSVGAFRNENTVYQQRDHGRVRGLARA